MKEKGRAETLYFFITERYQYSHAGPVNKLRQVAVKQSKQQRRQKGTAGNAEKRRIRLYKIPRNTISSTSGAITP